MVPSVYDFSLRSIDGEAVSMSEYRGRVLLVVNVASKCGFTPQYRGLEDLYQRYKPEGLMVLGVPCNQFGGQEPGDEADIQHFCQSHYRVSFPLFSKVDVNGKNALPLFDYLKSRARGLAGSRRIKWNFTKFLVGRQGKVIRRFSPRFMPADLARHIEELL